MTRRIGTARRGHRRFGCIAVSLLGLTACESGARQDPFLIHPGTHSDIMPVVGVQHSNATVANGIVTSPVAYQSPTAMSYADRPLSENLAGSLEVADYTRALNLTKLMAPLRRAGPYTVFAIPNAPLEQYVGQTTGGIEAAVQTPRVRQLLAYTIVKGAWDQRRLRRVMARHHADSIGLKTVGGATLTVRIEPGSGQLVLNNGAGQVNRLWLTGVPQSNGVLYFTQGALPPAGPG
ncbi:hypothetical protein NCH01_19320 [Neoasaia chiangmaiensis]|uniref:Uncharacterized protein n=2 Tax=Neoasaia chiangmaiensis TaxID=320497 RepID=A0A1U9KUI9_9PROT|nr:fasciclin domain-containing protein [Neoasaia chiangmaiensis]AQS89516.1 hypothetical protein A0U93_12620 [Neoasaia chiangmaiensis]GEN15501.1 hypothetical protein NCH01_19320 [Neoasaia chiangmaiensis]